MDKNWTRSGNSILCNFDTYQCSMINPQLLEFQIILKTSANASNRKSDKQTQKLLFYLFTSTRGGFTRLRIIISLLHKPCNTHQLAQQLNLDYKAVQHHLTVLEKNNLVLKQGIRYGAIFHLSNFLEANLLALDAAIEKLDKKMNHTKVYL